MRFIIILLMVLYMYSLTFGVFMTDTFRIPAPMIFCSPLIFFFREKNYKFRYQKELWTFIIAIFCFYIVGLSDFRSFAATTISVIICLIYFHYFIGDNKTRFNFSVMIFYGLLIFSSIIMVLNHFSPSMDSVRGMLMDETVLQSPSGIAISQFTYGYQLAALAPFIMIYTFLYHKHLLIKAVVFLTCLFFIYLGLQRSVFVTFSISVALFLMIYYRFKAVLIISTAVVASVAFYSLVLEDTIGTRDNILTKNINNDPEFNRSLLTAENLNIYADYPLGLVFYGKNWSDVIYRNQVFASGVTSHNAYLMFLTYLGPFLGLGLLVIIYSSIIRIGFNAIKEIRSKQNALLLCLCFSFLAASINALSHNAWLISADGPTLFLYVSIIHLNWLKKTELEGRKIASQSEIVL